MRYPIPAVNETATPPFEAELWLPVVGFPNYMVSSLGRVWSGKTGRVLRAGLASNGYWTVSLGRKNSRTVHSIVAEAFIGPCPDGEEVRHKDGVRTNCKLDNLHYGTRGQNIADAKAHGTWWTTERYGAQRERGYRGRFV